MNSSSPLVAASHLTKSYLTRKRTSITALSDVSLLVNDGEFVSIVGPSGCGKSTLIRVLCGLERADSGAVRINSETIHDPRSDVGIVFQNPVLLPWRNVAQNVRLPRQLRRRSTGDVDRVHELLELVGLSEYEERLPHELSGGMQQRVAIARALVLDPPLLMMDEPFGALDALTRERLNLELLTMWHRSRKSCVLVTHSIHEAVFRSDRVLVMSPRPGHVVADVTIDLPRPRTLAMTADARYGDLVLRLRRHLDIGG